MTGRSACPHIVCHVVRRHDVVYVDVVCHNVRRMRIRRRGELSVLFQPQQAVLFYVFNEA